MNPSGIRYPIHNLDGLPFPTYVAIPNIPSSSIESSSRPHATAGTSVRVNSESVVFLILTKHSAWQAG
jgi:hypothetical protein